MSIIIAYIVKSVISLLKEFYNQYKLMTIKKEVNELKIDSDKKYEEFKNVYEKYKESKKD